MFGIILFIYIFKFNNFTHSDTFFFFSVKNESLFIAADHGLYIVNMKKDSVIYKFTNSDSIPLYPYYSVCIFNNFLIFTSPLNLVYIDLENKEKYFYPSLFLEKDIYRTIIVEKDTIFLGGNKGLKGIKRNNTVTTHDDIIFFERKNYLPNDTIYSLLSKGDSIFIGTKKGLYKVKRNSLGFVSPILHTGVINGKIKVLKESDKKIFVSADSFLYVYPDSLITVFPSVINSIFVKSDTLFVGTEDGAFIFYNNQRTKFTDFYVNSLIKFENKIYMGGFGVIVYDYKRDNFLNFKNLYKELSSNNVSSVKKFGKYYVVATDKGIDIFNEKYERVNNLLTGWARTFDENSNTMIASVWCGFLFKIDSFFKVYDTQQLFYCIQLLKFIDDSTFFVLKPAQGSIEIRNLKDEKLHEIFNLNYSTDIESFNGNYYVSNTDGNIFSIDKNLRVNFLFNVGYPVYDLFINKDKIYLATNSGLLKYSFPDFKFEKIYQTQNPYTTSVISDKSGNIYALTRGGLLFISSSDDKERTLEYGTKSIVKTENIDFNSQCSASLLYYEIFENEILIGTNDGFSILTVEDSDIFPSEETIIFPNPIKKENGYFFLKTSKDIKEIYIYSPSGLYKKLDFLKLNKESYSISTSGIERGFYILYIKTFDNVKPYKIICE
ncbi:MAG: T9SS type A sorting domain-containing protein [Candidatus Hydrothermales bacterium]